MHQYTIRPLEKERLRYSLSPLPWWLSGKESAGNAGDTGDMGANPGLGPLEEGMETLSSILSWRIPRTEEPGGLHIVHRVKKSQT